MVSQIVKNALAVGGSEFAKKVATFEDTLNRLASEAEGEEALNQKLRLNTDLPESVIGKLSLDEKEETLENYEKMNSGLTQSTPRTNTREVEIPAPGQRGEATTVEVEYTDNGPSMEKLNEFNGWLNQARSRNHRQEQERKEESRNRGADSSVFTGYTNVSEVDGEDIDGSDIPAPGSGGKDDD